MSPSHLRVTFETLKEHLAVLKITLALLLMLATYIRYAPKSPKSDFQDLKRAPCGAQIQIGSKEELLTFHINNDNRDANQFRDNGA